MNYATLRCIETEIIYHAYKYHQFEKKDWNEPRLIEVFTPRR